RRSKRWRWTSSFFTFLDQLDECAHRMGVAAGAEAGEHRGRYRRNQRRPVDLVAPVDVRDMELDDRAGKHLECVQQRNGPEAQSGWIDDDAGTLVDCFMHPVDELVLRI